MAPRFAPTAEQLQQAWARCRKRTWPATLDEAMAHPLYSRLLHMNARMAAVRASQRSAPAMHAATGPPRATRQAAAPDGRGPTLDLKRRAAGERPDDD